MRHLISDFLTKQGGAPYLRSCFLRIHASRLGVAADSLGGDARTMNTVHGNCGRAWEGVARGNEGRGTIAEMNGVAIDHGLA
jgi:hypothetical protein